MSGRPDTAGPTALLRVPVRRTGAVVEDWVAAEVPVAIAFNGIAHAVMMATPQDIEDFAFGFALSEGIVDAAADLRDLAVRAVGGALDVQVEIAPRHFARLKDRRRTLAGRTGCGVCGTESLAALDLVPKRVAQPAWLAALTDATVLAAFAALPAAQPLNAQAGSLHAAAWVRPDGTLAAVREDVGRHNALDKLLGHLAVQRADFAGGFVALSSRASYELVRKCARLGVPALATVSAPTGLALQIAQQAGLHLLGWCRPSGLVRYQ